MTIRVALIIPTMDRGGAEKQLCLLATHLPRAEFDVHVILLTRDGPRSDQLRQSAIPVTVIGKRFRSDPSALFRLRRELKQLEPDIVHTWLFAANSFGRAAAKMAGVPTIFASERCVDPWKTSSQFVIDRALAKITNAITTNSKGVRDFYVDHGIDPQLFRVIPNGVDARKESTIDRDEACRRLEVPQDRKIILAVGRLWPQKRYRDLIWAAELVATLRQDTTLVIIGAGPQSGELMRFRDAVSIPKHVRFAGARDDVADLMPHANVFWLGSEYEGQSNSLIEAMQSNVAVVVSDIPGNRDLVIPNETGRLVPVGDRAEFARETNDLLENPMETAQMAQRARQRIETEFSLSAMTNAHAELYRNPPIRRKSR